MIKRSAYIEQMETAIAEGGPGSAIKMQGLRDPLHGNIRTAGRLVSRMSDRSHLSVDKPVQHINIGWANEGSMGMSRLRLYLPQNDVDNGNDCSHLSRR